MIDPRWLREVIALGEADTAGHDAEHLAALLDDEAEVLPYLMTRAGAFAHWPKARAAIDRARTNAPRSQPGETGAAQAALSPYRAELYERLRNDLLAHAVDRQQDSAPPGDHLSRLIRSVRFDEARGADSPSMFISQD